MFKRMIRYLFCKFYGYSGNIVWVTEEADTILISEMTDDHLLNACRCIKPSIIRWATLERERVKRRLKEKPDKPFTRPVRYNKNTGVVIEDGLDFINKEQEYF